MMRGWRDNLAALPGSQRDGTRSWEGGTAARLVAAISGKLDNHSLVRKHRREPAISAR